MDSQSHTPQPRGFIGTSRAMQSVYNIIESAAPSMASVFITGASGTGKDLAAQALHDISPRAGKPFIALNCAAIPRDLVESELFGHVKGAFTGASETRDGAITRAQGGTLFLDEICDMPMEMQSKMLRFLQNGQYTRVGGNKIEQSTVRIVCATNKDPAREIARAKFREDLFYRLHVIPIVMPDLCARGQDMIELAHVFLHRFAGLEDKQFEGFDPQALDLLAAHDWPGHVRELENVIRQVTVLNEGGTVTRTMLPLYLMQRRARRFTNDDQAPPAAIRPLREIEKQVIESAITRCEGNIARAAAMLEISPSTIYRKKAEWGEESHL
jgi:two-component system repressor protein LuxO